MHRFALALVLAMSAPTGRRRDAAKAPPPRTAISGWRT